MTRLEGRWCNDNPDVQVSRGGTQPLPNHHSVNDHNEVQLVFMLCGQLSSGLTMCLPSSL